MSIVSRHGLKRIKARAAGPDFSTTAPVATASTWRVHPSEPHPVLPLSTDSMTESSSFIPSIPHGFLAGPVAKEKHLTARSNGNDLTSMIAGSILGVLCFIGITALIVRFLLRRRQHMYGDVKSISSNGKLSRMSRNSSATLTSWYPRHQSTTSIRTGTSTASQFGGRHHMRNTSEPLATPKAVFFNNPFSKSAELCAAPPVDRHDPSVPSDLYLDPEATARQQQQQQQQQSRHAKQGSLSNDLQTIQEKPEEYPTKPERLFIPRSLYSNDRSIGSTIILPGRNSSVGSLQMLSYRLSSPFRLSSASRLQSPGALLTPHLPVDSRRRSSTRSDPFDLEDDEPLPLQYPLPLQQHQQQQQQQQQQ